MTQSLSKIIALTKDVRLRMRLLAVSHFNDGKSRIQISVMVKYFWRGTKPHLITFFFSELGSYNQ